MALEDFGFQVDLALSGVGLLTFGFLWECSGIWVNADPAITTVWGACSTSPNVFENCTD